MAALARAHRQPAGRAFPGLWLALAGSLVVSLGVALWIGPGQVPESKPGIARMEARMAPEVHPTPSLEVGPATDTAKPLTRTPRVNAGRGRIPRGDTPSDLPGDEFLPPLAVVPIEGTSPLVLPPIRTSNIDAPPIALPAIDIDALPAEPSRRGSF
jgi:hypothetical protein